jgi:hypothetical protein
MTLYNIIKATCQSTMMDMTMPEGTTKQERQAEREIIVTLRLPRELHSQLQALGGPRGLTREIRERLEASFAKPVATAANDPKIRDAATAITWLLNGYDRVKPGGTSGHWYDDPEAFWVVRGAVAHVLDRLKPEGVDLDKPMDEGSGKLFANVALLLARGEL